MTLTPSTAMPDMPDMPDMQPLGTTNVFINRIAIAMDDLDSVDAI